MQFQAQEPNEARYGNRTARRVSMVIGAALAVLLLFMVHYLFTMPEHICTESTGTGFRAR